jgi:predicted Zn finger-like uncharacterized protein
MQQMNQLLRRSAAFSALANIISKKVGKPWYESSFNTILTGERQYPKVYEVASLAARWLGLANMPAVYVEADHPYQSATYGSLNDSFINIGTLIPRLLNDRELLFVLGHELGHLLSEHALWTTVSMFLVGQHRSTFMSSGILAYFSNPLKVLEQGVESLVTNWMRVAEYTADRAALLVVDDYELARRVLFLLYFKSRRELQELDLEEWAKSLEPLDSHGQKITQIASSPTPYLGSRLKELETFYRSPRYEELRKRLPLDFGAMLNDIFDEKGMLRKTDKDTGKEEHDRNKPADISFKVPAAKLIAGTCPSCGARMSLPLARLPDRGTVGVTCRSCKGTFSLDLSKILGKPQEIRERTPAGTQPAIPSPASTAPGRENSLKLERKTDPAVVMEKPRGVRGKCPSCGAGFAIPLESLGKGPTVELRCNSCKRTFNLGLGRIRRELA